MASARIEDVHSHDCMVFRVWYTNDPREWTVMIRDGAINPPGAPIVYEVDPVTHRPVREG